MIRNRDGMRVLPGQGRFFQNTPRGCLFCHCRPDEKTLKKHALSHTGSNSVPRRRLYEINVRSSRAGADADASDHNSIGAHTEGAKVFVDSRDPCRRSEMDTIVGGIISTSGQLVGNQI